MYIVPNTPFSSMYMCVFVLHISAYSCLYIYMRQKQKIYTKLLLF